MKYPTLTLAAGALGVSGLACSKGSEPIEGPALSAVVAPLDLPAATDACYRLTVWNVIEDMDEDSLVWDQPNLCASQFGADNGIRFTGICDAQAGLDDADPSNDGKNAVRLVLNEVYKDGTVDTGTALTAGTDYINPCPAAPGGSEDNGCVLIADCEQNADTKIEFNLTVMRQASLGFFDTVVKISDVFCAAKLDCLDQDDNTLTYLHNPDTNADGDTAVLGFTCLGGSGGDISMYLDDLVITCVDSNGVPTRSATVDPSQGPGNITPSQTGDHFLLGAAVHTGEGFLGQESCCWCALCLQHPPPGGDDPVGEQLALRVPMGGRRVRSRPRSRLSAPTCRAHPRPRLGPRPMALLAGQHALRRGASWRREAPSSSRLRTTAPPGG